MKINEKKDLIVTVLVAILVAVAIIGANYYKNEKAAKQEREITLKEQQNKEKLLLQKQLNQQESDAKLQDSTLKELKQQVIDLKNRPPEIRTETKTIIKEVPQEVPKSNNVDYSAIVAEWQDRVAKVICDWNYSDGTFIQSAEASGLLWRYSDLGTALITNRHVVDLNGHSANHCRVGIYGVGSRIISNTGILVNFNQDFAIIKLGSKYQLPNDLDNSDDGTFDETAAQHGKVCTAQVNIGDKLIILGYPSIGTQGGITVTEGIVSGFEGDYYVTSAKIDHGNSGGAAILLKDDCYLGIPTWANTGSIESLGRILKSNFAFGT